MLGLRRDRVTVEMVHGVEQARRKSGKHLCNLYFNWGSGSGLVVRVLDSGL